MIKCNQVACFIVIISLLPVAKCVDKTVLVIYSSYEEYNTSFITSAVGSAAISNANSNNGYRLNYVEEDTLCDPRETSDVLKEHLLNDQLVAIVGCGCSTATMAIADYIPELHNRSIPVISFASPSTKLSNMSIYPNLFLTSPTFDEILNATSLIMQEFDWKQFLFITDEINIDTQVFYDFLSAKNIKLSNKTTNSSNLFENTNRVFILDAYGENARKVLCQAYKNSNYYPSYAWFILDNFIDDDWYTVPDTNCTITEMLRVLNHSIVIGTNPSNNKADIYTYAHDAITGLDLALHNQQIDGEKSIIDALRMVSFTGKSGNVSFTSSQMISNTSIVFSQLKIEFKSHKLTGSVVAVYEQGNLSIVVPRNSIWPLGVPSDGIPVIVIEAVQIWAFVSAVFFSLIGMICIGFFFVFIFYFREAKVIKITSPNLSYLLLLGAMSVFVSINLYAYPATDRHVFDVLCPIQPFLGSILGYDLCVTITTVKMWRIYYIFKGPHPSQRIPKDWHLLLIVGGLLSIDSILSIVLIVVDIIWFPPMLIHENKPDVFDQATGEIQSFYFWDCRYSTYFFTLIALVHNFIVHGIGIVLAFKIRKIQISVLNEYRYNLAILIVSVLVTAITVFCVYAIGPDPSLYAFFYSIFITIGCIAFLLLSFIPKIIAVIQDPNGENIFPDTSATGRKDIKSHEKPASKSSVKPPSNDQE